MAPVTPRQVVKDAFAAKLTEDGQIWIDMLDHPNLLSHTYHRSVFSAVLRPATDLLPACESDTAMPRKLAAHILSGASCAVTKYP
ncbi:MAG: nucleotidyltransferase substrate binding protein [Verrucomicrobiae bacterium]